MYSFLHLSGVRRALWANRVNPVVRLGPMSIQRGMGHLTVSLTSLPERKTRWHKRVSNPGSRSRVLCSAVALHWLGKPWGAEYTESPLIKKWCGHVPPDGRPCFLAIVLCQRVERSGEMTEKTTKIFAILIDQYFFISTALDGPCESDLLRSKLGSPDHNYSWSSKCLSVCLSVNLSVCEFNGRVNVFLSVCLSICLSVNSMVE